jgi:ApaG protein
LQNTPSSDTTTEGIRVQAVARFLPDESDPDSGRYLWAYRIRITNEGRESARLLDRHWIILDADNRRDEVKGEGVVGKKPRIGPGETHEYTSSCPLKTKWGTMEGNYTFERPDGTKFQVEIGRFFLVPANPRAVPAAPRA